MTDFEVKVTHEQLSSQSVGETRIERKRLHSHPHAQTWANPPWGSEAWWAPGVNREGFLQVNELRKEGSPSLPVIREHNSLSI